MPRCEVTGDADVLMFYLNTKNAENDEKCAADNDDMTDGSER